jgi:hypothetical protein
MSRKIENIGNKGPSTGSNYSCKSAGGIMFSEMGRDMVLVFVLGGSEFNVKSRCAFISSEIGIWIKCEPGSESRLLPKQDYGTFNYSKIEKTFSLLQHKHRATRSAFLLEKKLTGM